MRHPFASFFLPYVVMAALIAACGVMLELHAPAVVSVLDDLLTGHVMLFGAWLALAAAGVDYVLVTLHRKLRMGEVGAKSSAQLHLSGRR
ncbi:hypothetical protein [Burkholderia cenocepacia]|uniref:hypothetical protein n=1 Tax=Burkholderia cenocepacia TaxID=95486 RepID=UPI00222FFA3A|nr:hypothetical protein [Burkholderia cenocepacia]CAJ5016882.1 Uncharacterised protein [Burkholderia pseudomallei]MCW3502069.1 hypothetical protein [Burkholderia cenocepacia]MCW3509461.1 hypothetical protein [Burkholderia cenocepacia]MCW3517158.1 hypothetical protein [Burkholderia cenocepacia]MCW3532643.1 hypothetical protein [Burkholderia cenocepacia]